MEKDKATLFINGKEKVLSPGEPILTACEEEGIPFACTEGVCGTCCVRVIDGGENLSPFTEEEVDFFGEEGGEERLACQCTLQKGEVHLEE